MNPRIIAMGETVLDILFTSRSATEYVNLYPLLLCRVAVRSTAWFQLDEAGYLVCLSDTQVQTGWGIRSWTS